MKNYSELSKKELVSLVEQYEADNTRFNSANVKASADFELFAINVLQMVLDTLGEVAYIVDLTSSTIILANKKTEELFGNVVGARCWDKLQKDNMSDCGFCTNQKLLDANKKPIRVYKDTLKHGLMNNWYQCSEQVFEWLDGSMVAIKTAVDVSVLKNITEKLDQQLKKNKLAMQEIVLLVEKERRQLSHDLHDEMGQIATAINLNAGFLKSSQNTQPIQSLAAINDIEQLATSMLHTIKDTSNRLNPRNYIQLLTVPNMLQGLFDEWASRNPKVHGDVYFKVADTFDLTIELKETLYRLCQEALTNISKHADASRVEISYRLSDKMAINGVGMMGDNFENINYTHLVELEILDNGKGFLSQYNENSLGLMYMLERVRLLNGVLHTEDCTKLGGVKILAQFPYNYQVRSTSYG